MKAAVFESVGKPLKIKNINDPFLGLGELLLQVRACGICGTDLHMSENANEEGGWRLLQPGCVLGHEFSGEVIEVGRDASTEWQKGDRVTALPWIGCGKCNSCKCGRPYRCDRVIMRGSLNLPGAYSEFCRIGSAEAVRLPDELSFWEGALIEPLAVGLNAVNRANIETSQSVFIIGAGPVGLSVAAWCNFFGVQHILISDILEHRAKVALELGATSIIRPYEGRVDQQIADYSGFPPSVIFDCAGVPGSFQLAVDCSANEGKVIIVGLCMEKDYYFPAKALLKEIDAKFSYVYCKNDFKFVAAQLKKNRIKAKLLLSQFVNLAELPRVFEELKAPGAQLKVMLKC